MKVGTHRRRTAGRVQTLGAVVSGLVMTDAAPLVIFVSEFLIMARPLPARRWRSWRAPA